MTLPSPPTAVLALNLGISTGVLLDRIDSQRQLAYISLDETELSAGLHISAVVRDPEEVGRQAALLAISRVAEPELPSRTVTLPSHLIKRGSGEISAEEFIRPADSKSQRSAPSQRDRHPRPGAHHGGRDARLLGEERLRRGCWRKGQCLHPIWAMNELSAT